MLGLYLTLIDSDDDKAKFTRLYNEYRHLMLYIAQGILDDEQLSEDAVQEAFLRIAKNFSKVGDVFCPQTRNFAVIITKNVARTMYHKINTNDDIEYFDEGFHYAISDTFFERISVEDLSDYISRLPEKYRFPLYLYYFYGYSVKEVSGLLSISVEASKKRLQRARHMIKQMIERDANCEK